MCSTHSSGSIVKTGIVFTLVCFEYIFLCPITGQISRKVRRGSVYSVFKMPLEVWGFFPIQTMLMLKKFQQWMFYSISGFGNEECECFSLFAEKLPQTLKNEKGGLWF